MISINPRPGLWARGLVVAMLPLATAILPPFTAHADDTPPLYPEAAGRTVVTWEGITGITLMLPNSVRIRASDLEISAEGGTEYVFAAFRSHSEPAPFCDFCIQNVTEFYPQTRFSPSHSGCYDDDGNDVGCPYKAQPLELYLVSDGAATLSVDFEGFDGSAQFTATGEVDGVLEEIPARGCYPAPDCTASSSYGGVSHEIGLDGRPALALVDGYLYTDSGGGPNPGLAGLEVCAYPAWNDQGASGDPQAHPRGCDEEMVPGVSAGLSGGGAQVSDGNSRIHGEQYLGFSVWNKRVFQDATFGVWGLWLESGIACPSGTFLDCLAPPA